MPLTINM